VWLVARAVGRTAVGSGREEGSGLVEQLRYACAIGLSDAVGGLSRTVDRLVVVFFFSVETFGLYHLGAVEVPVSLLLAAVATVLVPEISRLHQQGDVEAIGCLWRQAVGRLALVVLPLFSFLFCFAEPLILAYLSAAYARSLWVFRLFLLVLPLRIAVYNPLLVGMGRASWALWGGVGDLLLNLLLSVALVQLLQARLAEWAYLGPALAAVVSTYVQVGVLVGLINRHLGLGLARLLLWGELLRVGAFSGVAGLLSLAAASSVEPAWARLAAGGVVFAGLLAAVLWLQPARRRELRQILGSLLRS
jgi:O-antigen/teichoic acid export membrane protein